MINNDYGCDGNAFAATAIEHAKIKPRIAQGFNARQGER